MKKKGFEYQYFIKVYLGNTRVVLSQTGKVLQQNSYYPFGMLMAGLPATEDYNTNKYLYNGKELQEDFALDWYDYGARFYDAQLGRWHVPDPLAGSAPGWSPYRYGFGNPMNFIDTDGLFEDEYDYDINTHKMTWVSSKRMANNKRRSRKSKTTCQ